MHKEVTEMELVRRAFVVLGWLANLNGRRLERAYRESRYRLVPIQHGSPMLTAVMAPRKVRRQLQGKKFRPVPGYRGPAFAPPNPMDYAGG